MKTWLFLVALQVGSAGSDAYFTHRDMANCLAYDATVTQCAQREGNPIVRPFVKSTGMQIAYFAGSAAIHIELSHIFRRHHHNKIANVILIEGIAEHTGGAVVSSQYALHK